VFYYDVKKYIGSYAAAMGGVDAVVFTAGVGENGPILREEVTSGMEFMGITPVNQEANHKRGVEIDISGEGSKVRVLVIPTNEELMIAMDTAEIVKAQ
jgi:acetate kinase